MFTCMAGRFDAERIQRKYDAEYDIPPGPEVSWVEHALLEMVMELEARVVALESQTKEPPAPNNHSADGALELMYDLGGERPRC